MPLPPREEKRARGPPDGTGPDSRRKGPGPERTAGGQAERIVRKAGEPQDQGGARPVRDDLQARQDAGIKMGPEDPYRAFRFFDTREMGSCIYKKGA